MTTEQINSGLIEVMRDKIPAGTNLAKVLMDLLCIGKEAVYRRLRGEVPFTLAEAAIVSGKMGISLDKLVGAKSSSNAVFDINIVRSEDPIETYYSMVDSYLNVFCSISNLPGSHIGKASNRIPHVFTMGYENLSRFRFIKWMYQNHMTEINTNYSELVIPDKLFNKQREYVAECQNFSHTFLVWDSMLFTAFVNDIKYFASINAIKDDQVRKLKAELQALIEELYTIAVKGTYRNGNEVHIYISNINFEASYSYIEADNFQLSMLKLFSVNSMTSTNPDVFKNLKLWINSLKKFSILISQSGEMQRIQFFNRQREIVDSL